MTYTHRRCSSTHLTSWHFLQGQSYFLRSKQYVKRNIWSYLGIKNIFLSKVVVSWTCKESSLCVRDVLNLWMSFLSLTFIFKMFLKPKANAFYYYLSFIDYPNKPLVLEWWLRIICIMSLLWNLYHVLSIRWSPFCLTPYDVYLFVFFQCLYILLF